MNLTEKDLALLSEKGISEAKVREQIETFKEGIPFVQLEKAVTVGEGIMKFAPEEAKDKIAKYEAAANKGLTLLKFVPASGAASRMFKALFNFLDSYDPSQESLEAYFGRTADKAMKEFSEGLRHFAFYDLVMSRIAGKASSKDEEVYLFVKEMMSEDALNYGFYPKGLLPFHKYGDHTATPFEEHLKEAAEYAKSGDTAELHFTISPQHGTMFNAEFESVKQRVSHATQTAFKVSYSFQKPSTDTIAVDMENEPFRNADGSVLFRPGGHGALIENLNEQEADIIFIKNIDNVTVPRFANDMANSKKLLAGVLLGVQEKAFGYARRLEGGALSEKELAEIKAFLENELNVRFNEAFDELGGNQKAEALKDKINRPIRVCGMVKNEGEPGGGPFWINDRKGNISLQIIESAQIDMNDPAQARILKNATHFNPVDLVCAVKNHKGEKYDLMNFVDPKQGFITGKTKEGRELKALELPGLWNGAMAFWNTIFVEVPSSTFNPVKTVNDLLRPAHQVR
ncbi:DUF4301 family protein [Pseudozobellia thermophila]|uniref:DUF4301 domain-containing protein n=1 Tax=Pseudozobellia thermophila TaxID=192903 RepID=A0A1M6AL12_9FLAO|nr:DUF4301 family protein [Pseudozobellia thermophila]SHI37107.1 protein of unknown function [Pseudozobellia thermophila]